MADDDDEVPTRSTSHNRPQEVYRRTQETQVKHTFPNYTTGIVPVPVGSRGPRSLYIKRNGDSFGFTLRHFIVYPPDSVTESDGRHAAVGALSTPMDTIFVIHVKDGTPAKQAGLQCGDRIVGVNRIPVTDKTYQQVVQLIQNSPDYLNLFVVPSEEDILQRYFAETAYNPASNQRQSTDLMNDRQRFLGHTFNQLPGAFRVDAASWKSLQNSYSYDYNQLIGYDQRGHRNSENLIQKDDNKFRKIQQQQQQQEIYYEIQPNEYNRRTNPRAQPQVPLYKRMGGRRASDVCTLSDRESYYESPDLSLTNIDYEIDRNSNINNNSNNNNNNNSNINNNNINMKTMYKSNYLTHPAQNNDLRTTTTTTTTTANITYPNVAGCRLSLDASRRESASSLNSSSLVESSQDSLTSYESTSTLTGHETDDSIMSRFRKSFQQKEEFLRTPISTTNSCTLIPREFYSQAKKFDRNVWPPIEQQQQQQIRQESPTRNQQQSKPTHQNFQRIKNDIDNERYDIVPIQQSNYNSILEQERNVKSPPIEIEVSSSAPPSLNTFVEDKQSYPQHLQMVIKRARQFESGKPLPEDDPLLSNRTSFYRSELARLSSKKVVPNVCERAQEYEIRSSDSKKDIPTITTTIINKRPPPLPPQRDSRSLESSGSNNNNSSIKQQQQQPLFENSKKSLSGNVLISTGSKYLHCPPPSEYDKSSTDISSKKAPEIRARSNSTEESSWLAAVQNHEDKNQTTNKKVSRQNAISDDDKHIKEKVKIDDNNLVVVKRRPKTSKLADERTVRRESYLKATEGGRMYFDSDLSDVDASSQTLRSAHRRWRPPLFPGDIQQLCKLFEDAAASLGGSISGNSSSSVSLDRDKTIIEKDTNHVIREGSLHCKITEIDGKRFGDRSWKQIWAILRGPKLFLNRHHQTPVGNSSADAVEQNLSNGIDMRASVVRVAEDYTKRKNVLRVSSVKPCRSEILLQADNPEELAEWVKSLQEQMATTTEFESKLDSSSGNKQQAVPQQVPALTTIEVQGSRASPQLMKSSKSSSNRNRSPTGQSPVSKTRKPSQIINNNNNNNNINNIINEPTTSPKSKTWRGRVAKQFRKMQGASSPSSPTTPEGSTFGIPLEHCIASTTNPYIPRFVQVCTDIVDERGLNTVGIYRVPGNNASITALTEEINRNYEFVPIDDPKWNDLHVVSSLLKSYFRKMPDSLVTNYLYPSFIKADKIEDGEIRMKELKRLIKKLPPHNYHTLKHIILHLKRVVEHSDVNKMEAKNLAIVFGPTIVRPEEDNMETMVNNMTHQCKIVETLLTFADWFFSDDDSLNLSSLPVTISSDTHEESESVNNQALLLDNISKYEALKDKEKNGALFSSIISAAQRKVKRKPAKTNCDNKDDSNGPIATTTTTSTTITTTTSTHNSNSHCPINVLKEISQDDSAIPTTVTDIEKQNRTSNNNNDNNNQKQPWFNYSTDQEEFHRRIENFKQETNAMLRMSRILEISVPTTSKTTNNLSSSTSNVNQQTRFNNDTTQLLKTNSASNVLGHTIITTDNSINPCQVQYNNKKSSDKNSEQLLSSDDNSENKKNSLTTTTMRKGNSIENLSTINSTGTMKKLKYENEESTSQKTSSLDSLNKISTIDDGIDLVASLTKLYDEKKEKHLQSSSGGLLAIHDSLPYADESPDKQISDITIPSSIDKENIPELSYLYRNPSLHKSNFNTKEMKDDLEKDEDSTMSLHNVPDKTRQQQHVSTHNKLTLVCNNKIVSNSKLKRSESLNKPETNNNNNNVKVKRSESLNKTGDRLLKRSDSLTKNEKTENNLNKRRELLTTRRIKDLSKLKRKNGMPDRSIKRRHTVGGTKDPDKVTWLDNNYYQHEEDSNSTNKENNNSERNNLRTSSPDLSSTRRDRLYLEILTNENMVMALRQHLIGASRRPQSFPESTTIYKVPLESHV